MKVLILSCSTGGGHNSCARYVLNELEKNNIEAVFSDFYDIVNKGMKEMSSKVYLSMLGGNGGVFKNVYKLGELYSKTKIKSPVYLVNKFHKKSLYDYIISNKIDLVIATHLFPALTLTAINKDKRHKKINFITIATDYEPCPFLEECKPNYFIMQSGLEDKFIKKGISSDVLFNSGIPVSSDFVYGAKSIRNELEIKNEKVILIMLGSMGFGKINKIIDDILNFSDVKVLVVCGSNKKLYDNLSQINDSKLKVFGFVNNINDLIYSSDIVLSKPGGLSSTEITSIRKPLLHIFPIPGIETYNTNFFESHGMSIKCESENDIITNLEKLLNDHKLQDSMIKNQEKYINKNSCKDLVDLIKNDFN